VGPKKPVLATLVTAPIPAAVAANATLLDLVHKAEEGVRRTNRDARKNTANGRGRGNPIFL